MLGQIVRLLRNRKYIELDNNSKGIWYREDEQTIYVVTLSDAVRRMTAKEYLVIQSKVEFMLATRFRKKVEFLHVILAENGMFEQQELQLLDEMPNAWLVAKDTGKLYIFERQILDFDNLYSVFEKELPIYIKQTKAENTFRFTPVNTGIVILNIIFFLVIILTKGGIYAVYDTDIMLSVGALSYDTFMSGAWYQIITSFFLHFGFEHLINNMILLMYVGCELERRVGKVSFFLIYISSGVVGNIVSLWYYYYQGEQVVSAGASGAIFGVIGALFVVLVSCQIKMPNLSPTRLLVMAGITIYYGITSVGVDNAAHIGGFFAGIIGGFLLSKISRYGKLE